MTSAAERATGLSSPKESDFEQSDILARKVGYALLGLLLALPVSAAVVAAMFFVIEAREQRPPVTAIEAQKLDPPRPRLETSTTANRIRVEAAAQAKLDGYAWVDRRAGRVRIPIEEAMRLTATRGWPDGEGAK